MHNNIEELARICYSAPEFDYQKFSKLLIEDTISLLQQEWYDLNNAEAKANESLRDVGYRVGRKSQTLLLINKIKQNYGVK